MREYSPYAVTQLRGVLHKMRRIDVERRAIEKKMALCVGEARAIGFRWTYIKALLHRLRAKGDDFVLMSDDDLVALYREVHADLTKELEGTPRAKFIAKSGPIS